MIKDTLKEGVIVGVAVIVLIYAAKKMLIDPAIDAIEGGAINPANPDNIANRAFGSVFESMTGTPSLGSWIYDVFHPGQNANAPTPIPQLTLENVLTGGV